MAEWLKAHAWKACLGETLTWVRIPLSPPNTPISLYVQLFITRSNVLVSVSKAKNRHQAPLFFASRRLKPTPKPTPKNDKFRRLGHTTQGVRNGKSEACSCDQENPGRKRLAVCIGETKRQPLCLGRPAGNVFCGMVGGRSAPSRGGRSNACGGDRRKAAQTG